MLLLCPMELRKTYEQALGVTLFSNRLPLFDKTNEFFKGFFLRFGSFQEAERYSYSVTSSKCVFADLSEMPGGAAVFSLD